MAHLDDRTLLLLFIPSGSFVWFFPPSILPIALIALLILFACRYGKREFVSFLKTWGGMALFWAVFSLAASVLTGSGTVQESLFEAGSLFSQLVTLFLLTAFLGKETTPIGLTRACYLLMFPLFRKWASDGVLALLLMMSGFRRFAKTIRLFLLTEKLRLSNLSWMGRMKLLLARLVEEIEHTSELSAQGLVSRGLETLPLTQGRVPLDRRECLLVALVFIAECGVVFYPALSQAGIV